MQAPSRKALLIGAPGGSTTQFLPGVERDPINMQDFLLSPRGGAWKEDEIIVLDDPDLDSVYEATELCEADYVIKYFSGHGFETPDKRRFLNLSDGNSFEDMILLNDSPRQLIILDACRNIIDLPIFGRPPHLGEESTYGDPMDWVLARKAYDNWIRNSSTGKLILHSTSSGTSSFDTPVGGVFTNALLSAGKKFEHAHPSAKLDILSSAKIVIPKLRIFDQQQKPTKTYMEGNIRLPFALSPNRLQTVRKSTQAQKNRTALAVGIGLVALGLAMGED